MASQAGKTDFAINVFCERLQNDPVPLIYVGPSRHFVERKFEPRFEAAINSAASLAAMRDRARRQSKTQKHINGVEVSFVWSGSASAIAGQPAGMVIVDELDRMEADVDGEGDIIELSAARHRTYAEGKTGVFSTPLVGKIGVERHPATGLEHWSMADQELVQSRGWRLWQRGTRHEWMWRCPHCSVFFAPRFRLFQIPEGVEPGDFTEQNCFLACPHCGAAIYERDRAALNEAGVAISPGESVDDEGRVIGVGVRSTWYTLWVSGFASPWLSWVKAARQYADALRFGTAETVQGVVNTTFGELYSVSGEAPSWEAVGKLRGAYASGELPEGVNTVLMTVDVQQDRLYYVVRGWSIRRNMESWALEMGTIEGATNEPGVWDALEQFKRRKFGALTIKRCFVDQKYRTQYVMAFCHEQRRWAFPAAGRMPKTADAAAQVPLKTSNVEVRKDGKVIKGGVAIKRWTLNTDFFKRWVHDRISRGEGGGYHIPIDATDDYCQQLVSEARVVKPGGRIEWVQTQKQNHFLDCEQMQVACAYSLRLQHYAQPLKGAPTAEQREQPEQPEPAAAPQQSPPPRPPAASPQRPSGWMSRSRSGGRWMR